MKDAGIGRRTGSIIVALAVSLLTGALALAAGTGAGAPTGAVPEGAAAPAERFPRGGPGWRIGDRRHSPQSSQQPADKGTGGDTVTVKAGAGMDGFYLKSTDGNFLFKFRLLLQLDGRFYADDTTPNNIDTFLLRRARPILEGTLFQRFDFLFVPDFGQGKTVIQDAYLDSRFLPEFKLRAGKFKTPFELARLQSDPAATLVEKGLPSNLGPDRDIGVMVHGDLAGGTLGYAAAILNGVADGGTGDTDINDSKEMAARLFWTPFKKSESKALKGLGVGLAATWGSNKGTASTTGLGSYKTFGQQTFFSFIGNGAEGTTVVADGSRDRFSPQAYWYVGRLGLLGEYVSSKQEVTIGTDSESLKNSAWSLDASFLLTDDEASFGGVNPRRPFGPKGGGIGAFDIAVRYGKLTIDENAFPIFADPAKSASEAEEWELGVNWYLNKAVRFALDGGLTRFKGGAANGEDREDEKVLITRFQLSF